MCMLNRRGIAPATHPSSRHTPTRRHIHGTDPPRPSRSHQLVRPPSPARAHGPLRRRQAEQKRSRHRSRAHRRRSENSTGLRSFAKVPTLRYHGVGGVGVELLFVTIDPGHKAVCPVYQRCDNPEHRMIIIVVQLDDPQSISNFDGTREMAQDAFS